MSIKPYVVVGGTAAILGIILEAIGAWQVLEWLFPPEGRIVISSILFIIAIICLGKAAWSAWSLETAAKEALNIAQESNRALERRVEEAEAKLVKAIDEQVINWAPAHERLEREAEARFRQSFESYNHELRETFKSFNRRTERGEFEG